MTELSASTEKMYRSCINVMTSRDVNLESPQDVLDFIMKSNKADSTKKTYICAAMNYYKKNVHPFTVPKEFTAQFASFRQKIDKEVLEQIASEKEQEKFVSWEDLLAAQKKWAEEVNWEDFTDARDFLIFSLYTLNDPVRADYGEMRFSLNRPPKESKENWLWWGDKKKVFIFRNYKTVETYGEVKIPVSPELEKVLTKWFTIKHISREFLLGGSYTPNALVKRVLVITQRRLGKKVGINIFRHSRITHELQGEKAISEKAPLAANMLHSRSTQESYRFIDLQIY